MPRARRNAPNREAGHTRLAIAVPLGILTAAVSLLFGCGEQAAATGGPPSAPVPDVEVGTVGDGPITVTRRYLGLIQADQRAELGAGAAGEVTRVTVREGDHVERGTLLVQIDPRLARAAVRSAEAERARIVEEQAQAARDAERFSAAGDQAVSQAEVEQASSSARALEAQAEGSAAALAQAREELERHRVTAPFAGVVARRAVDPGDWVQVGAPVVELVASGAVEVLVRVEPELLMDVSVGMPVALLSRGRRAPARVEGIVPALEARTRTAQLRVLATDEVPWLRPGATVDVQLTLSREGAGVVLSRDALVFGVATTRVFTVHDGKAKVHDVQIVDQGRDLVRVTAEGLVVGDRVVTRGNEHLRDGQDVHVVGPSEEQAEVPPTGAGGGSSTSETAAR